MRLLVTGATGFIGKHLTEALLLNGNEVVCVTRKKISDGEFSKPVENIICDLREIETIDDQMQGIDVVIHAAAQLGHYGIPYEYYYKVNYLATLKLAELAIKHRVKQFIFCSAPFVTGLEGRNVSEDAPYHPTNPYSETKMLAEQAVIQRCKNMMPYTILRPCFVYGAGDVRRTALYRSIKKKRFVLTTNGKAYLHPTYVSDIVDGFLLSVLNENAYNEIFNLGAEQDCTVKEYLECIAKYTGSSLIHMNIGYTMSVCLANVIDGISKVMFKKAGFVNKGRIDFLAKDHSCDISKARRVLGYAPQINLETGIRRSVEWAKENGYL